jgi:hypothetical protein
MIPFPARFNAEQRKKLTEIANKLNVTEAEALRILIDTYGK